MHCLGRGLCAQYVQVKELGSRCILTGSGLHDLKLNGRPKAKYLMLACLRWLDS